MGKRESSIEKYLDQQVREKLKGITFKWGTEGLPDRVVCTKGWIFLVELKTPDGELSKKQIRRIESIKEQNITVWVLNSHKGVDRFIKVIEGLIDDKSK